MGDSGKLRRLFTQKYAMTALNGIKVLDLSRVLAGPWITQTMADLGARVIKVERPEVGDDTRTWGPPFFETDQGAALSAYFMSANRGKDSICIDLTTDKGCELVKQMAAEADVLVENFKSGDLKRRGLDYESLSAANPRLIYCSVTGFGQSGPYRDRPGYDFMIQAMGGLMSITGEPDQHPQKVGVALADVMTGLYGTIAVLAALEERHQSGQGQYIDMALLDVLTASLANQASNYRVSGQAPVRLGNAHPNVVPYQTFETSDGYFVLAVGNDRQFQVLCRVLGRDDLASAPEYQSNADRVVHRETLAEQLAVEFRVQSTDYWLTELGKAGVPAGPINDIGQLFEDEHVRHRQMAIEVDGMPLVANPIKYSRSQMTYDKPPPALGADTQRVLSDMGLDESAINELINQGIVS